MARASERTIAFTPPMECLPVERLSEGDEWVFELKLDGYRAEGIHDTHGIRLLSKNGKDLSKKYPGVASSRRSNTPSWNKRRSMESSSLLMMTGGQASTRCKMLGQARTSYSS